MLLRKELIKISGEGEKQDPIPRSRAVSRDIDSGLVTIPARTPGNDDEGINGFPSWGLGFDYQLDDNSPQPRGSRYELTRTEGEEGTWDGDRFTTFARHRCAFPPGLRGRHQSTAGHGDVLASLAGLRTQPYGCSAAAEGISILGGSIGHIEIIAKG